MKTLAEILKGITSESHTKLYGDFRQPQTPGLGGLDELTTGEELTLQQINSLEGSANDVILFWDASATNWELLSIGTNLSITGTTLNAVASTASGAGNVFGPASSTARSIAIFTDTTGTAIAGSNIYIDSSGTMYPSPSATGVLGSLSSAWSTIYLQTGSEALPEIVLGDSTANGFHLQAAGVIDANVISQFRVDINSQATIYDFQATQFLPSPTDTLNLGGSSNYWKNAYFSTAIVAHTLTADDLVLTNPLSIIYGGTGASSSANARTNLGLTATGADTTYAFRSNNLNDLASTATARINLGLVIGTDVEAWSSKLDSLAGLSTASGNFIEADGNGWVVKTATQVRSDLGLSAVAQASTATSSDVSAGKTSTAVVTPNSLSQSIYGTRVIEIQAYGTATSNSVASAVGFFRIPSVMNNWVLSSAAAAVFTAGSGAASFERLRIRNVSQSTAMLSTDLFISAGELDSMSASTGAVISVTGSAVVTGDQIAIDIVSVNTTAAAGLIVELQFKNIWLNS